MDHYTTIDLNKEELIKRIELQHGLLWDKLLELGVVDPIAAQSFRDEIKDDRSQVKALLSYIQKQPASQYLIFREALKATGQDHIVKKYLPLEPRLPEGLRLKLAQKYLSTYRNIILWGSGVNPQAVKFDAVYTDMAWKTADTSARKNLEHYTDMLKKDNQCQYRGICVWGDAGIGKSVFTAKLCQDWALVVTAEQTDRPTLLSKEQRDALNKLSHEQRAILWNIDVLVCIILRDVNEAQNLSRIIESQLILKENETDTIMKFFESKPRSALLVLDGLDEIRLNEQDELFTTLTGISYPEVGYIVTCRPFAAHGIKLVVDAQVELCGFNEAQANAYILAYYHIKFPDNNKEQIKKEASICWDKISASQDLLEMAMNPSMLQLMCLLYTETGKIGKDRTQVFKEYTTYLLVQYHKKKKCSITYKDELYHKNLMTLGNLALSGLHLNHFQLIFFKSEITGKHGEMPFEMGFLTELPSYEVTEPKAQFLHKSLQEYLAAYFIVNSQEGEGVAHLMKFCSISSNLMSSQMIISFISVMSKKMGKIVQAKVKDMITEWENKDEISPAERLSFLYTMLKNNKNIKFPLPKEINMNIASHESRNKILYSLKRFFSGTSTLERLFGMDSSGVSKINVVLGRNGRLNLFRSFKWTQVVHIELDFDQTTGPDDGQEIEKINKSAKSATVLVIKKYGKFGDNERHHRKMFERLANSFSLLTNLDTLEITSCQLTAEDTEHIAANIEKSSKLTKLRLAYNYLSGARLGELVRHCPSLQELDLTGCGLETEDVEQMVADMPDNTGITKLRLAENKGIRGGRLGELMRHLPALQELDLTGCALETEDVEQMVADMPGSITRLMLAGNNRIRVLGASVIELASRFPHLASLDLGDCEVIVQDLDNLLTKIPQNTNITRLCMADNAKLIGGSVIELARRCPHLASVDLNDCEVIVQELLDLQDLKNLLTKIPQNTNITRLCMANNTKLTGTTMDQLVNLCPELASLELSGCDLVVWDLKKLLSCMPHNTNITRLRMEGKLEGKGAWLGELVRRCPDLRELDLAKCGLKTEGVEQMVADIPDSTGITTLILAGNHISGAAVGRMLQRTPSLQLLDVCDCNLSIPGLLRAAGRAVLTNLLVLDLSWNSDYQLEVSSYLASMPRLQALSVAGCRCDDMQYLLRLVASLPPSLTHLNVCMNRFRPSVVEVLQHKERLARLHRLNIGWWNQDDERRSIREELQRLNPQLLVYHDYDERMWDMYKDTTQVT